MKVLMFGWELPPFNAGGLGVACAGLAKALQRQGIIELIFVLPRAIPLQDVPYRIRFAIDEKGSNSTFHLVSLFSPYHTSRAVWQTQEERLCLPLYGMFQEEVMHYALSARIISREEEFDVIHAHDWLCIPAGMEAQRISGKPLVVHIHATEFDRTGFGSINEDVYAIERAGVHAADCVVAVSHFTKNILIEKYGADPRKVVVVHNGVDAADVFLHAADGSALEQEKQTGTRVVLFVGRITLQKGPDYFIRVAKRVLEQERALFVMCGSGDMERQIIEEAAWLGIGDKVLFAGFLRGADLWRMMRSADVLVMPSVSEPFGIVPLEALAHGIPVVISKQSGVSEVLRHALKVDFWDIDEMANQIIAVLRYAALQTMLVDEGKKEALRQTWDNAARTCALVYDRVVTRQTV